MNVNKTQQLISHQSQCVASKLVKEMHI